MSIGNDIASTAADKIRKKELSVLKGSLEKEKLLMEIKNKAYELFLQRNRQHGDDLHDWYEAEKIIKKKYLNTYDENRVFGCFSFYGMMLRLDIKYFEIKETSFSFKTKASLPLFCHEYTHYLQTVRTYQGLGWVQTCIYLINKLALALKQKKEIITPISSVEPEYAEFLNDYREWKEDFDILLNRLNLVCAIDLMVGEKKELDVYAKKINDSIIPYIILRNKVVPQGYPITAKVVRENQAEAVFELIGKHVNLPSDNYKPFKDDDYEYTCVKQILKTCGYSASEAQVITICDLLLCEKYPTPANLIKVIKFISTDKIIYNYIQKITVDSIDESIHYLMSKMNMVCSIEVKPYIEEIIEDTNKAINTKEPLEYINYFLKSCFEMIANKDKYGWNYILGCMKNYDLDSLSNIYKNPPIYFFNNDVENITDGFILTKDKYFTYGCYYLFCQFEILTRLVEGKATSKYCLFGKAKGCNFKLKGGPYCFESLTKVPKDENDHSCIMSNISCSIGIYDKPVKYL